MNNNILKILFLSLTQLLITSIFSQDIKQDAFNHYYKQEYEEASKLFIKLWEDEKGGYQNFRYIVECLYKTQDYNKLEFIILKQQNYYPEDFTFQLELAKLYKESGSVNKAFKLLDELADNVSENDINKLVRLSDESIRLNFPDYAIKFLEKAINITKDTVTYLNRLSIAYAKNNNLSEGVKLLMLDMELNDSRYLKSIESFSYYIPFSMYANELENLTYQKIEKNPSKILYTKLLIMLILTEKKFDEAFNICKNFESKYASLGETIVNIAYEAISYQKYDIAIVMLEHILDDYSKNYYHSSVLNKWKDIHLFLLRRKDFESKSRLTFKEVYAFCEEKAKPSEFPEIIKTLARAAIELKDYNNAAFILRKLIDHPYTSEQDKNTYTQYYNHYSTY